jgi:hypothetical protein
VWYFLPTCVVQVKIMNFTSLPGETSDLQSAMLKEVNDKFALQNKIVQTTQTLILVVAKELVKPMCGENWKFDLGEKLLVLVVGHI